ncbi:MAG TPA: VCBS repeat-containing protein [Pyrinomonadaceae bacterium]|jgi:hypothetical protein|nr:VCBS repeat-containing protein [Pyrinomonadaceae bacterium]
MTLRRTLIILAATFSGLILLLVVAGALFYKLFISPVLAGGEPPPELREAKVVAGADFLKRSEFYRVGGGSSWLDLLDPEKAKKNFEDIMDVSVGQFDGKEGTDVVVVGRFGLTVFDTTGKFRERANFKYQKKGVEVGPLKTENEKDSLFNMRALDVEGDGVCEVLGYGGLDGVALFDHAGRVVFSRGERAEGKSSIRGVAAGDVDGDGTQEFVALWGDEPWEGLELFDRHGQSKWRREERHVNKDFALADVNGDGKAEIILEDMTTLTIRDASGEVTSQSESPVFLWHVGVLPRPERDGPPQNLAVREGSTWLIDFDGKNWKKFDAPLSHIEPDKSREESTPGAESPFARDTEQVYRARGAWVRLKSGRPKYLAVVGQFAALDRSLLYVYDEQGRLVYHEILPETCESAAALPPGASGAEEFLVGCENTVWRYAAP